MQLFNAKTVSKPQITISYTSFQITHNKSSILSTRDRQCTHIVTMRDVRANIVALEKRIGITYFECVSVALGIEYAMRMRHIVICDLSDSKVFFFHIMS